MHFKGMPLDGKMEHGTPLLSEKLDGENVIVPHCGLSKDNFFESMSQDEQTIKSLAKRSKKPKIHVVKKVSIATTTRSTMVKTHVKIKQHVH